MKLLPATKIEVSDAEICPPGNGQRFTEGIHQGLLDVVENTRQIHSRIWQSERFDLAVELMFLVYSQRLAPVPENDNRNGWMSEYFNLRKCIPDRHTALSTPTAFLEGRLSGMR